MPDNPIDDSEALPAFTSIPEPAQLWQYPTYDLIAWQPQGVLDDRLLESEGFKVRAFGDPEDFLNEIATNHVRLVVLDIWMERMTGMELLAHLCARSPETRVIFITGHDDHAAEVTVMRAGAAGFFIKPLDNEKFIAAVRDALKQS